MPTTNEIHETCKDLRKEVDSLRAFDHFLKGLGTALIVILGVGGFWIKATFNEINSKLNEARNLPDTLKKEISELKNELDTLDSDVSLRVNQIEKSVTDITSQPLMPKSIPQDSNETLGEISTPKSGVVVGREFSARGTVKLSSNQVAWLAVRIGRLYWPKEPAIVKSGQWHRQVYEGGASGRKWLSLLVVERDVNMEIEHWLETSRQTGSYPGMRLDQKAVLVAEIEIMLK